MYERHESAREVSDTPEKLGLVSCNFSFFLKQSSFFFQSLPVL